MKLASESIYSALVGVKESSEAQLDFLGVDFDLDLFHPNNHEHMTYTEAVKIARKKGSSTEWGEGLKHRDEQLLTAHMGGKYVWVEAPPFESEGFPYKRHPDNPELSTTCDLIAPHGSGEMVGVAEKIVDPEELIQNIIAKGLKEEMAQYWSYIAMREYGMPEHGGIGAAPERIIYGMLGLDHIRETKPWARYPGRKILREDKVLPTFGNPNLERLVDKYDL